MLNFGRETQRDAERAQDVTAQNVANTNGPVRMRDAFVSIGKLVRLKSLYSSNLTFAEQKAARESANQETIQLLQVAGQLDLFNLDDYSPSSAAEAADLATGFLHGILDLTPEQFSQIRQELTKYEEERTQEDPRHKVQLPDFDEFGPALDRITNVLSEPQHEILAQVSKAAGIQIGKRENAPRRDSP